MKKILLILGLVSMPFFGQVISFEASEGFNLGNVHGQQGWVSTESASGVYIENQVISDEQASEGTHSLKIIREESIAPQQNPVVGAYYNVIPVIPVSEYKMSFDVFFNEIGPNIYGFNPTNLGGGQYVALVWVNETGMLQVVQGDDLVDAGLTLEAQKWYSIAYKAVGNKLEVYVDGVKVTDSDIFNQGNVDQVRFMNNNAGGAAYIDNIRFGNEATFAVGDIATKNDLKVYPNPVKDYLSIDVPSTERVKSVSIFSVDGRSSVLTFDNNKADFSNLPAGVYVLQVETDSQTYTKKVIKK